RRDREARVHPGHDVGDGNSDLLRAAARQLIALAGDAHQAAHALEDEIVSGEVRAWAVLAVAGHRAVDDAGVDRLQLVVAEPVFPEAPALVILQQPVAFRGERARDPRALGVRDIERDRFLAAVHREEIRRFPGFFPFLVLEEGRAPAAGVVPRPGTLDLDHLGAQVGEVLRRPGAREHARQIEYADVRDA